MTPEETLILAMVNSMVGTMASYCADFEQLAYNRFDEDRARYARGDNDDQPSDPREWSERRWILRCAEELANDVRQNVYGKAMDGPGEELIEPLCRNFVAPYFTGQISEVDHA